ncbi:MAG: hypothetical protein KDI79_23200 [Anaerolineae bacterium]|nr:hypothetical protein [Anaerolineae bacterium]
MKTYRTLQLIILAFVLTYAITASCTWYFYRKEIFPLFSWQLFSHVSAEKVDFGLRVTHIDDRPLNKPVYFEEAPALFPDAGSIVAYSNIQALGQAIEANRLETVGQLKIQFENRYLSHDQSLTYEIVKRKFIPIDRRKSGDFVSEETLTTLQASGNRS